DQNAPPLNGQDGHRHNSCRSASTMRSTEISLPSHDGLLDESAALAVLDFEDPQVRIETDLFFEISAHGLFIGAFSEWLCPHKLAFPAARLIEHGKPCVEARQFQKQRARFLRTASHEKRVRA